MMGVMRLGYQIGDRQLQLIHPKTARLVVWCQPEARAEKQQDVRSLRNHLLAGLQEWRRERRIRHLRAVEEMHHRRHRMAGNVDIVGIGFLQRKADEFASPLDAGPVVQFVTH